MDKQYREDSARLAELVEKYTNIPQERVFQFVMENTADNMLPYSYKLCRTVAQRDKLTALFEFKNLYETIKNADKDRAYQLKSVEVAKDYFKHQFADLNDRERFLVAYLNTQLQVIKTNVVSVGTIGQTHVFPREIVKEALFLNASAVMMAHNHPSGEIKPSQPDKDLTERIDRALHTVDIKLLDHIIVGGEKTASFLDMGLLPTITLDISKPTVARELGETARQYSLKAKQPRIKEQIAFAKEQLAREHHTAIPQKKMHDRGDR